MTLLWFWMVSYGVAFLIADAKLLETQRTWLIIRSGFIRDLCSCYFCLGFWIGVVLRCCLYSVVTANDLLNCVLHGFGTATFCYALNAFILYLELNTHDRTDHQS